MGYRTKGKDPRLGGWRRGQRRREGIWGKTLSVGGSEKEGVEDE